MTLGADGTALAPCPSMSFLRLVGLVLGPVPLLATFAIVVGPSSLGCRGKPGNPATGSIDDSGADSVVPGIDASPVDGGPTDGGLAEGGPVDGGPTDAGA